MSWPIEQPSSSQTDAADMLKTSAVHNHAFHGLFTTDTWPRRVVQDSVAGQTATIYTILVIYGLLGSKPFDGGMTHVVDVVVELKRGQFVLCDETVSDCGLDEYIATEGDLCTDEAGGCRRTPTRRVRKLKLFILKR